MKRPSAILFDIGDTLLHEVSFDLRSGIIALGALCHLGTVETDKLADAALAALATIPRSGIVEFQLAGWLHERLGRQLPASLSIDEIELHVWQHTVRLVPMPGVVNVLSMLQEAGITMGGVSNAAFSSPVILYELGCYGLSQFLRFVISSADIGVRKPDAAIFNRAVAMLDSDPADIWFVGDSWENDVLGASKAGMWPVWLSSSDRSSVPYMRVADWSEFNAIWQTLDSPQ